MNVNNANREITASIRCSEMQILTHSALSIFRARTQKNYTKLLLLLFGLSTTTFADNSNIITIVAPAFWCPFSCKAGEKLEGFAIDIVRAAFNESNISVRYWNLSYDRALAEVHKGSIDGAIPVFKEEAPGFIYPAHPVSASQYCFYTRTNKTWNYSDIDSVKTIRLVATSGYTYNPEIDAYLNKTNKKVALLKGNNIPERMFKMVKSERMDVLLDDTRLIDFLKTNKRIDFDLRKAGCLEKTHYGFLALSPNRNSSFYFSKLFDEGIKTIRKNGTLKSILNRYGIDDWKDNRQTEEQ
jgi:polar amino acid transport system substrate-binding protein